MRVRTTILKPVLITIALLLLQTPCAVSGKTESLADGEPAWTLKIPKGRYPCLCDTPPHLWRQKNTHRVQNSEETPQFEMTEAQFQTHIERTIFSRLRLLIEHQFEKAGPLSCEVRYKLLKERTIENIEILVTSKNTEFDNYVLKALESLKFGFDGFPQKQGKQFLVFQSVITPDRVYPGFSGKLLKENAPGLTDQMDKLFE